MIGGLLLKGEGLHEIRAMRLVAHDKLALLILAVLLLNYCHWLVWNALVILPVANSSSFPVSIFNGYDFILALLFLVAIFLSKCDRLVALSVIAHVINTDRSMLPLLERLQSLHLRRESWMLGMFHLVLVLQQLLEHHLVVLVKCLVDVFEQEVVVRECRVSRFHKVLEVLMGQTFFPREGSLRV